MYNQSKIPIARMNLQLVDQNTASRAGRNKPEEMRNRKKSKISSGAVSAALPGGSLSAFLYRIRLSGYIDPIE